MARCNKTYPFGVLLCASVVRSPASANLWNAGTGGCAICLKAVPSALCCPASKSPRGQQANRSKGPQPLADQSTATLPSRLAWSLRAS